ncbi:MAG TPA: hypothetical protein VN397_03365 [Candidatus Methylomirabilis sp.]|nr:hypothetical protein [Candidatus Methylomirabilis sp.]
MNSRVGAVAQLLFVDLLGSIVWFPVWWYTKGLSLVSSKAVTALKYRSQGYAFRIWIRNFFVPMYGQHDIWGRIISVFMRFVVLVGRSIAIAVEAFIYAIGVFLWLLTPPVALLLGLQSGALGFVSDRVSGGA